MVSVLSNNTVLSLSLQNYYFCIHLSFPIILIYISQTLVCPSCIILFLFPSFVEKTIDWLATASGVRWYGHLLRRDNDSVLRVALDLEVSDKRK